MCAHWQSDPCYSFYGVDGSTCSILIYLSEMEHFCPMLVWSNSTAGSARPKGEEKPVVSEEGRERGGGRESRGELKARSKRKVLRPALKEEREEARRRHWGMEFQSLGGPLGELVQWADITAALYFLGHNVKIAFSLKELQSLIGASPGKGNYPVLVPLPFDLVYTDYHSLGHLHGNMGAISGLLIHLVQNRVFNHRNYANLHSFRPIWGSWNLQPQQYMTMFPHTPDNSFMGFVSEELYEAKKRETRAQKIQNLTVKSLWQGKDHYLETISKVTEIHGTVYKDPERVTRIPSFVINHSVLSQDNLQQLLKKAKVISHFQLVEPHTPYEFTCEGMLEHIFAYITHQVLRKLAQGFALPGIELRSLACKASALTDFCSDSPLVWPPHSAVVLHMGQDNESCVKVCQRAALICEPAFFYYINSIKTFSNLSLTCNHTMTSVNHSFPAYKVTSNQCYLANNHLFSCAGSFAKYRRLCPCRNYREGQTAFCKECL
uniref:alpha-1,6-mannosyl-glycoprotein 6-beta-N-acetylglucosaminyltransferase n=1 Tax=Callorhinchus milii TaxID=7868 RepID=A0A4W3HKI0_CALMI